MAIPSDRIAPNDRPDLKGAIAARSGDQWPAEREGYEGKIPIVYAGLGHAAATAKPQRWLRLEERFGSLMAGGGIIWTSQAVTNHFAGLTQINLLPPGPLETCAIGVLVWLHAKWRRSLRVN